MRFLTHTALTLLGIMILADSSYALGKKRNEPTAPEKTIDFSLGEITLGGAGCPQGTRFDTERTGNDLVIRIRPTSYDLELNPEETGSGFDRKGCALAITVARLAEHSQLKLLSVSFQGKYDIRAMVDAKIRVESFILGDSDENTRLVEMPLNDGNQDSAGDLKVIVSELTKTCKTESQILRLSSSGTIKVREGAARAGRSHVSISDMVLTLRAEPCQK